MWSTNGAKALMIRLLGFNFSTWVQALRFLWLLRGGTKEPESALLIAFLGSGDIAVDVGANGGDWTCALARQVGNAGRVFAFEADPYYAEATEKTIRLLRLKNVSFQKYGLSNADQEAELLISDDRGRRVSGRGRVVGAASVENAGRTVRIRLRSLDSIAAEQPALHAVKFIKCDVEGFELMVMRGALALIEAARPLILAETGHAGLHGYRDSQLGEFFEALRYCRFRYEPSSGCFIPDRKLTEATEDVYNCLFVPGEKVGEIANILTATPEPV
jgi:FkbM family methyltransferase